MLDEYALPYCGIVRAGPGLVPERSPAQAAINRQSEGPGVRPVLFRVRFS